MAAFLDENTQFQDVDGKPIVNGKLYIGIKGLDPILNPEPIFSDRALTVALANPQTLGSLGRSANKIWIAGEYSLRVDNTNNVQKLIDLDAGATATTGTTILSDVQGSNTITATASPTITGYVDGQIYVLQPAADNTGATTANIDSIGAKSVVSFGEALVGGELLTGLNFLISYNSDNDNFDLFGEAVSLKAWSPSRTYTATESALGSDGMIYFSLAAANLNNDPTTDTTSKWRAADQLREVAAGGTVDAITATLIPALGALQNGFICRVRALGANATTTPTFAPNGLTAKTIVKKGNQALAAGDIFGADHELLLVFNSTNDNWELLNPAALGDQSLITNGFQEFPGGLILQWGTTAALAQNTTITVTLPVTFPTATLNVRGNKKGVFITNVTDTAVLTDIVSASQITVSNGVNGGSTVHSLPIFWQAIGH